MREIKFRVWDGEEMFSLSEAMKDGIVGVQDWSTFAFELESYFDDVVLMQYTGLKDKNGVEIYEGDIVEYKDFSGGLLLFKEQPKSKGVVKINLAKGIYLKGMGTFEGQKVEVIGNIYENPELITQKEGKV